MAYLLPSEYGLTAPKDQSYSVNLKKYLKYITSFNYNPSLVSPEVYEYILYNIYLFNNLNKTILIILNYFTIS